MKRTMIILIAWMLLCACQPTPDYDAVKQKDTNLLIDTVLSEQKEQEQADAPRLPVKAQFPARFQCDFYTDVRNVHVTADVPLRVMTDGGFPLLRVERTGIDTADQYEMIKRCFGTDKLYIWQKRQPTKKEVAERIVKLLDWMSNEEQHHRQWIGTEEDWEFLVNQNKAELDELQNRFQTMSDVEEQPPYEAWDGSACNPDECRYIVADPYAISNWIPPVDLPMATLDTYLPYADVSYQNMDPDAPFIETLNDITKGTRRIPPEEYDTLQPGASVTAQQAIDRTLAIVDGFGDFKVIDVQWCNDADHDGDCAKKVRHWFYSVRLSRVFEGACTTTSAAVSYNWEDDNKQDDSFVSDWGEEYIAASIGRDGTLLDFSWRNKLKQTEVLSPETPLLPLDEIIELLKAQLNRVFTWEDHLDGTIVIDNAELGLMRIREKNNMESGLLVPVWYFTGSFVYAENQAQERLNAGFSDSQAHYQEYLPLHVINAIDGTIIDPEAGY